MMTIKFTIDRGIHEIKPELFRKVVDEITVSETDKGGIICMDHNEKGKKITKGEYNEIICAVKEINFLKALESCPMGMDGWTLTLRVFNGCEASVELWCPSEDNENEDVRKIMMLLERIQELKEKV